MEIPLAVRARGLEPLRRKTPDPKSGAATNYATLALFALCKVTLFTQYDKKECKKRCPGILARGIGDIQSWKIISIRRAGREHRWCRFHLEE